MKKVITAVVVVLMVGSGAWAAIGDIGQQAQSWDLGLGSTVAMTHGTGSAGTIQGIGTLVGQSASSTEGTSANQGLGAVLFQKGNVMSGCCPIKVEQGLNVTALGLTTASGAFGPGQEQSIKGCAGSGLQFEGIQVTGTQELEKEQGGEGYAEGKNLVGVGLIQGVANNSIDLGEGLLIIGGQVSAISGDTAASAGTVSTDMSAQIIQIQAAN